MDNFADNEIIEKLTTDKETTEKLTADKETIENLTTDKETIERLTAENIRLSAKVNELEQHMYCIGKIHVLTSILDLNIILLSMPSY